ncbi:MAG: alpha-L-fucosidase, partial [bacterium]|nr:alpha-L-fucosidase [bacterium]
MTTFTFPHRAIHLDFHTSPLIPGIGADFDPETFGRTFKEAHVDSVTIFATCHHGHAYYDTQRPERHPGLAPGFDLTGAQIAALHRQGIRAPIYMSVQVNEYYAAQHPEWLAIQPDGKVAKGGEYLAPGWKVMDMSSPYQDVVAAQLDEILAKYGPVDGIFMDMCWDQPSVSKWALDGMRRRGYDPLDAADRAKYAREVSHQYMGRFHDMVERAHRGKPPAGVYFNSRPRTNLYEERKYLRHIEIECLPTGGWGYAYFPYNARFVRPLGLPTLSMTGRFHKSWGDFGGLKPEAALKYECCLTLSQGMSSSVGDQLHPRGVPDRATYELIGNVYRHIEACEPLIDGARIVSEAAVVIDPEKGDRPGPDGLGTIRALQQLRVQFDLLPPTADLAAYPLVIVSDSVKIDEALRGKLRAVLDGGGALIVSGPAALDANGKPAMDELGIAAHGPSPFTTTYLRVDKAIAAGLPVADHVMYERGFRMTAAPGAKVLCHVVEPYFERGFGHFCSHAQTPPEKLTRWAAVVQNGRAITFAMPILTAYGKHGNVPYRRILG